MRISPVPGHGVTTPWGRRGRHWSCRRDANGNGIHTGADWAAPNGTNIVAPLAGVVRHTSQGSAFGPHQFFIVPDADPRAGIFFAHTQNRPANGSRVTLGQVIAQVGALGNATGAHLHLEWWLNAGAGWGCANNVDPVPMLTRHQGDPNTPPTQEDDDMVVIFMQRAGTRFAAYPSAGVYRAIPSPGTEQHIRHITERAGGRVIEWSAGQDVDDLAAFGVLIP